MKNNKLPFKKVSIKSRQTRPHVWKQHNLPPSRGIEEVLHSAAQSENVSWPKKNENMSEWTHTAPATRIKLFVLEQSPDAEALQARTMTRREAAPSGILHFTLTAMVLLLRRISAVMMRQKISAWASVRVCVCLSVCKTTTTKCIQNVALDCSSDARRKMPAETAEWI